MLKVFQVCSGCVQSFTSVQRVYHVYLGVQGVYLLVYTCVYLMVYMCVQDFTLYKCVEGVYMCVPGGLHVCTRFSLYKCVEGVYMCVPDGLQVCTRFYIVQSCRGCIHVCTWWSTGVYKVLHCTSVQRVYTCEYLVVYMCVQGFTSYNCVEGVYMCVPGGLHVCTRFYIVQLCRGCINMCTW